MALSENVNLAVNRELKLKLLKQKRKNDSELKHPTNHVTGEQDGQAVERTTTRIRPNQIHNNKRLNTT